MRCDARPAATVVLRYGAREVLITGLSGEPDPNLLDLCGEHVERLTPPLGWTIRDSRAAVSSAAT